MKHGPWGDYLELAIAAGQGEAPPSIKGRSPVAIERSGQKARYLYEYPPDDREPVPSRIHLPIYVYCG